MYRRTYGLFDIWPHNPKWTELVSPQRHQQLAYEAWFGQKTVAGIVPTRFHRQSAKVDLDLWPRDSKSKRCLLSSSATGILHVKFESDLANTVVCSVPTRFYTQRVPNMTLTFDNGTQNQQGSPSEYPQLTCEVWKWLDKNCGLYRIHNILYTARVPKLTMTFYPVIPTQ